MRKSTVGRLVTSAVIGALYAVLTLTVAPLSFGFGLQLRLSEALCVLPLLTPDAVAGLTLGCFISNAVGAAMGFNLPPDIIFGTTATLAAAWLTWRLRSVQPKKLPLLALLPPIIINAAVVGVEYTLFMPSDAAFAVSTLMVGLSEACVVYLLGLPLYFALKKLNIFNDFANNNAERTANCMSENKNYPFPNPKDDDIIDADDGFSVESASECTGLIPNGVQDENEVRSYADIYDIPVPEIDGKENKTE